MKGSKDAILLKRGRGLWLVLTTLWILGATTIAQLAEMLGKSVPMAARWFRELRRLGAVIFYPRPQDTRGRPIYLVVITARGCRLIGKPTVKIEHREHQVFYVNVPQLAFRKLAKLRPDLSIRHGFPPSRSTRCEGSSGPIYADGVIVISVNGQHVLFFIEGDRATEPLRRSDRNTSLEAKIRAYQSYRVNGAYREWERRFDVGRLKGFRVLFIVPDAARRNAILALCRQMGNCDFVWITELDSLQRHGLTKAIWHNTGSDQLGCILGGASA